MTRPKSLTCRLTILLSFVVFTIVRAEDGAVRLDHEKMTGFLEDHCVKCHGPKKQKGKVRLDILKLELDRGTTQPWHDVLMALENGEMPPEEEARPDHGKLTAVIEHLKSNLPPANQRAVPSGSHADEPKVEAFNQETVLAASNYLDGAAVAWARKQQCITCHTTGTYMAERPGLTHWLGAPEEELLKNFTDAVYDEPAYKGDFWFVWRALGLAEWDKHVTGELSVHTARALDAMFSKQLDDGSWDIVRRNIQIPHVTTNFELAVQAARAMTAAPGWLDQIETEELRQKVERLKAFLREHKPRNDYELALKLQVASRMPDLLPKAGLDQAITMLRGQQLPDGGWSTRRMSDIENWSIRKQARLLKALRDKPDVDSPGSDAYMTAFAIVLLRESDVPAVDEQIQRGIAWLKSNQRKSGRWWMESLSFPGSRRNFTTYIATAQAMRALALCGELDTTNPSGQ